MVNYGYPQHKNNLEIFIEELKQKGYHVININGRAPDAIATKHNRIFAVESLGVDKIPKSGLDNIYAVNQKRKDYDMFDGVLFKIYERKRL